MSLRSLYKNIMYGSHESSEGVAAALETLKSRAKPRCKRCYGRGFIGRNVTTGLYHPCPCTARQHPDAKV